MSTESVTFRPSSDDGEVTGALMRPDDAWCLYVFAHGAGAGMGHEFMVDVSRRLAAHGVATFRFNFPYMMQERRRPPNPARILVGTVRAAVDTAREMAGTLPLFAGGKSMGGRMTSTAQAQAALPDVLGLAFVGFPLHPPGRESTKRADHLTEVGLPMLFLQGTRDKLASLDLLRPVLDEVSPTPRLHVVDGADHGFHVLKRSGRTEAEVRDEICDAFAAWARALI